MSPLPENPDIYDIFKTFPNTYKPLLEYHERLLRGDESPIPVAIRELIAAYTSGLNACQFCYQAHRFYAEILGVDNNLLDRLLDDFEHAEMGEKTRELLRFVRKLNDEPAKITAEDRRRVLQSGWSEEAIHDAAAICGLYNLMNRIIEGMGVKDRIEFHKRRQKRLDNGQLVFSYSSVIDDLGLT